jgi:hypothetical protein
MKSNLKIFKDDSFEIEMMLKQKLKLLQYPIDILTEHEVTELKTLFSDYSSLIEKLVNNFNKINEDEGKSKFNNVHNDEFIPIYNEILKQYKEYQNQIELYLNIYEEKKRSKNNLMKTHSNYTRGDSVSEFSDYADSDKFEISRIFLNSVITTFHVSQLQEKKTLEEERNYIKEIFNFKESYPNSTSRQLILIDFFMNNYKFCLDNKFSIEKISTLMSIIFFIFSFSILNKKIIKDKSINIFRDIMEYHSLNRPPYCYEIFTSKDKEKIIEFFNKTFYRNYTLFENIFKYNVNVFITSKDYRTIPSYPIPSVSNYQITKDHKVTDPKSLKILNHFYFSKDKKIEKEDYEEEKRDVIRHKEQANNEKLQNLKNSFYKPKEINENERILKEKLNNDQIIQYELKETENILKTKLPEIIHEANEYMNIVNSNIMKSVNNQLAKLSSKK